jgi:hypothetical protein
VNGAGDFKREQGKGSGRCGLARQGRFCWHTFNTVLDESFLGRSLEVSCRSRQGLSNPLLLSLPLSIPRSSKKPGQFLGMYSIKVLLMKFRLPGATRLWYHRA